MGFKIDITGDVKKIFRQRTKDLLDKIEDELVEFAYNTVADAQRLAPTDESKLKQSISYTKSTSSKLIQVTIVVAVNYAAYIEFGTGKFAAQHVASLPKEWKEFAARFRGPGGGTFDEFIMRLTKWVERKGIGAARTASGNISRSKDSKAAMRQAAYAIAISIMKKGIRPSPFLRPAIDKNRIELMKNLKALK